MSNGLNDTGHDGLDSFEEIEENHKNLDQESIHLLVEEDFDLSEFLADIEDVDGIEFTARTSSAVEEYAKGL